jgi:hypothetical protein
MRAGRLSWNWVCLLPGMLVLPACSGKHVDVPRAPAEEQLYRIGKAYVRATYRLKRAPTSFEEIKKSLEEPASEDLLRSPNDGQPFVIHWGVDFNKLAPGKEDPFTVVAYEKTGVEGQRYVLRYPTQIVRMDEETFRKAVFPPGYQPLR